MEETDIKKMEDENARLKNLVEEKKKLVTELEDLKNRELSGGKSFQSPPPDPKKEITPKEYAQSIVKGVIP